MILLAVFGSLCCSLFIFHFFFFNPVAPDEPLDIELPNQWLWDIVDEFIYQVYIHNNEHGLLHVVTAHTCNYSEYLLSSSVNVCAV